MTPEEYARLSYLTRRDGLAEDFAEGVRLLVALLGRDLSDKVAAKEAADLCADMNDRLRDAVAKIKAKPPAVPETPRDPGTPPVEMPPSTEVSP